MARDQQQKPDPNVNAACAVREPTDGDKSLRIDSIPVQLTPPCAGT